MMCFGIPPEMFKGEGEGKRMADRPHTWIKVRGEGRGWELACASCNAAYLKEREEEECDGLWDGDGRGWWE